MRTHEGHIHNNDIKQIYPCFIICLRLEDSKSTRGKLHLKFKKSYPFSFSVQRGLDTLQHLELELDSTVIKYTVPLAVAKELLSLFFSAKLLHSPEQRTRTVLDVSHSTNLLQPTPKGVAILDEYCQKMRVLNSPLEPKILNSDFNTMDLITLDRNSGSDNIIYNEYWSRILFTLVMGPEMNVWSPTNPPDEVSRGRRRSRPQQGFPKLDFQIGSDDPTANFIAYLHERSKLQQAEPLQEEQAPSVSKYPFYHRYFTNPNSDSHTQYYLSSKGVRVFESVETLKGEKIQYCFSGKALVQYLMDCTNLMYVEEAISVATTFLTNGLMKRVDGGKFEPTSQALFVLTDQSNAIIQWDGAGEKPLKQMDSGQLSLKQVLRDPGTKYLFRQHLIKEYCEENLDAFDTIKDFECKYQLLVQMHQLRLSAPWKSKMELNSAVDRLHRYCLSKAYTIYTSYLETDAATELNIGSSLHARAKSLVEQIMRSPVSEIAPWMEEFKKETGNEEDTDDLREMAELYKEIKLELITMLEKDSLPKFLRSDTFKQTRYI